MGIKKSELIRELEQLDGDEVFVAVFFKNRERFVDTCQIESLCLYGPDIQINITSEINKLDVLLFK